MVVAIDCALYGCYKERGEQRPLKMMAIDHEDAESPRRLWVVPSVCRLRAGLMTTTVVHEMGV